MWKNDMSLGLQSVELCVGTQGYQYAFIRLAKKKRASEVQKIFEAYDRAAASAMQIKLTNLPNEPAIVGFGHGYEFRNHVIFKEIERARNAQDPSYLSWDCEGGKHGSSSSLSLPKAAIRFSCLSNSDMVPSSFKPACFKQQAGGGQTPRSLLGIVKMS